MRFFGLVLIICVSANAWFIDDAPAFLNLISGEEKRDDKNESSPPGDNPSSNQTNIPTDWKNSASSIGDDLTSDTGSAESERFSMPNSTDFDRKENVAMEVNNSSESGLKRSYETSHQVPSDLNSTLLHTDANDNNFMINGSTLIPIAIEENSSNSTSSNISNDDSAIMKKDLSEIANKAENTSTMFPLNISEGNMTFSTDANNANETLDSDLIDGINGTGHDNVSSNEISKNFLLSNFFGNRVEVEEPLPVLRLPIFRRRRFPNYFGAADPRPQSFGGGFSIFRRFIFI